MPVQDFMSKDLVTVDEDASIIKASKLMKQNRVRTSAGFAERPPAGHRLGPGAERGYGRAFKATTLDIHEMYYLLDRITVKSLMPKHLFTIAPGETVEKAAAVMLNRNISALPVVDQQGALQGIITKGGVFRAFVSISGIDQAPRPWAWAGRPAGRLRWSPI